EFDILFDEGISRASGLIDIAETMGILTKTGTWFSFGDEKIGQGKENARLHLKENTKLLNKIETEVRRGIGIEG
ncbi:MAG: DNA recombination/repair protein RecA, partial [Candidatus Omnitrophica bacterium]|nr:DNA recombination/repair protein RecA [Candidatus Omnitrophota bacterium]